MTTQEAHAPVLETVVALTEASLERCDLSADELVLVRLAALAAVDAPPISYLAHVGPAMEAGVTIEQVQNVLVGVAPVIGTPRVMSAAASIAEALGIVIAVTEEQMSS